MTRALAKRHAGPAEVTTALELLGLVDEEGKPIALPRYLDARGKRWTLAVDLGPWAGYRTGREVLRLAERYSLDFAGLRSVVTVTTVDGKRREVEAFDDLGCYLVVQLAQTDRGRSLRLLFATWLRDAESSRAAPKDEAELYETAQRILRASVRSLKALTASTIEGRPILRRRGLEVMAEVTKLQREPGRLLELEQAGGVAAVAPNYRKPLRRDDA